MTETEILNPNFDINIWLRTCEEEVNLPLPGNVKGFVTMFFFTVRQVVIMLENDSHVKKSEVQDMDNFDREIPQWLQGSLIRNGPGCNRIGSCQYQHLFDGLALIHKFTVKDGRVTYQCRFLRSETYKKNKAANRIVITEFGTKAFPDPCRTIFDRISSIFSFKLEKTDNAAVSIYPFGDQIYAMTEVPKHYKIDPDSLETLESKQLSGALLVAHTAHPHVMPNGDVYNVGLNLVKGNLSHVVVKFPYSENGDMFEAAEIVGSAKPRWRFNPAYMHSFGITENYFVMIEQPLCVSLKNYFYLHIINRPFSSSLETYPGYETNVILIHRETGAETRYSTDTIFFMHVINCFESNGEIMVDICSYKDSKILDTMYIEALQSMHSNPDFAQWCQSRPKRIVIPLDAPPLSKVATRDLVDVGVETPRINYEMCNGRPYRYFYGLRSDVDTQYFGSIIKVDTKTGEFLFWYEPQCSPSEPIFIARPNAKDEDDGVLLSAVLWGNEDHAVTLLVLNARDLKEIARAHFTTPSQIPKCFHGWFLPDL